MAKLNIIIDTETQENTVTVNGVLIDNVQYVTLSNWSYDGQPSFHFNVEQFERDGDVEKRTTLYANKKELAIASKYDGLFQDPPKDDKASEPFSMSKLLELAKSKQKEA